MKLAAASATDQGRVRANNEDAFLIDDQRALFAVADGMGGHRGGEVASHTAIEALRAAVAKGTPLHDAITRANEAVIARAAGDDELTGMGTTMTAVVAVGGRQLLIGHVGDSRAYLLHEGTLHRATDDHSLVEELVREGRLTPEQAESHPQRAIVTRALGVDENVDVDLYTIDIEAGDRVVLCSDGLTTMVRERDIERLARTEPDPQRLAEALVAAANTAGGEDNTTVVVIDVLEVDAAGETDHTALIPEQAPGVATSAVIAPPDPPERPRPKPARERGSRGRTVRGAILVLLPLLLIVGAATAALGWYARSSYFVGASGGEVVIYKGVPGGVLGWNPTIDERTGISVAALPTLDRDRVQGNSSRGSHATAQSYVERLQFRGDEHDDDLDHHDDEAQAHDPDDQEVDDPHDHARNDPDHRQVEGAVTMALSLARSRRRTELSLGVLVVAFTVGGYILVALANGPKLPSNVSILLAWVFGLYLIAHLAVRKFAAAADGTLLPIAAMLNGIGFVMIARLAGAGHSYPAYLEQARVQSVWVTIGIVVFVVTLIVVRDVRVFERYRYIALLLGIGFMLLPLVPVIGQSRGGGRLWVGFGPLSFEPNEVAKVLLVAFFASYLSEKRELLTEGRIRLGRWFVPSPRDLGPLIFAWIMALLVLAYEQDIGTSLLFFGVFAAMLYMTTRRAAYIVGTVILLVIGAFVAYKAFGHVRVRVENWTNPWKHPQGSGLQPIQGWYALGSGGIAGTGLGLGQPWQVPLASTDYMFTSIGEELGLVGSIGVIALFMLFVGSAFRVAVDTARPFTKLFAAGIATIIGLQTFLIIGGVTRVIPLTGISLPFVSYGGSSLVANFALLAVLMRLSDESVQSSSKAEAPAGALAGAP